MNKKKIVKNYLVFTKKDRIGIYSILVILLLVYSSSLLTVNTPPTPTIVTDTALAKLIDTMEQQSKQYSYEKNDKTFAFEPSMKKDFTKGELFSFDPNTLSAEGWSRLGLKERTIKTILNYRNKGGKFYKPEDIQRIWGLPDGFYDHVASYIAITSLPQQKNHYLTFANTPYEKTERKINSVDINQADTSAFIALPGIGSKLASRIVNFRDKLGGFYAVEQVKETYGLPDSTFEKIKGYLQASPASVKKFNINSATKEELKVHPYIKWQLANAIIEYRNQHGIYKSLNDLKSIMLIDETTFNKIAPYLIF